MADDKYTQSYHLKDAGISPQQDDTQSQTDSPTIRQSLEKEDVSSEVSAVADNQPTSQAVMDMKEAGLSPDDILKTSKHGDKVKMTKDQDRSPVENFVSIAKFRWLFLLILSLTATAIWALEAQYSGRPYNWLAWGLLALTVILTIPTAKFMCLPTRGGLAALGWSGSFFISALYGPPTDLFKIPAAIPWAGVLILVIFWVAVAIWRKLGRYKVIDLVLAAILLYAALSPFWSVVDNLIAGQALTLKFEILSASPGAITNLLPWFLWPMTIMIVGILPLAALLALSDQFTALKRRGGRHGGDFFLALAFIGLIPYGFMTFNEAMIKNPDSVSLLRSICPEAAAYARETNSVAPAGQIQTPVMPAPTQKLELVVDDAAPITPSSLSEPSVEVVVTSAAPEEEKAPVEETLSPKAPTQALAVVSPESELAPSPNQPTPAAPEASMPEPLTPPPASFRALEERLAATEQKLTQAKQRLQKLEMQPVVLTIEERLTAAEQELAQIRKRLIELEQNLEKLSRTTAPAPSPLLNGKDGQVQ